MKTAYPYIVIGNIIIRNNKKNLSIIPRNQCRYQSTLNP